MRSTRKSALMAGGVLAMAMLLGAAVAWACVPAGTPGTITASPPRAKPGQQVKLTGLAGGKGPVSFFLSTAGSAPIAELPVAKDDTGPGYNFDGMVTLPASAPTGYAILVASQDNVKWQVPITLLAAGDDPTAAVDDARTNGSGGTSSGPIAAIVAVVVLAGIGAFTLRRRAANADTSPKSGVAAE